MAYLNDEINNQVRKAFNLFFYTYDGRDVPIAINYITDTKVPFIGEFGITDFIVKENEDLSLKIEICLQRPGILIGYRGNVITGLEKFLKEQIKREIKIHLFESTMFSFSTREKNKILQTELVY